MTNISYNKFYSLKFQIPIEITILTRIYSAILVGLGSSAGPIDAKKNFRLDMYVVVYILDILFSPNFKVSRRFSKLSFVDS